MSTIALGRKIKHPEWSENWNVENVFRLYRQGKIPKSIDAWMLIVAVKYPLRSIYGSDLRAAWCLLIEALSDKARNIWWVIFPPKDDDTEFEEDIRASSTANLAASPPPPEGSK